MLARLRPRLASALRRPPLVAALHPLPPLPPARASCRLLSRRARPPERPVERRKGPDGQWYSSQAVFRMTHPRADWESAEVERRRDVDGKLYTLAEFRSFYAQFPQVDGSSSDADGVAYQHWSDAKHWDHRMTKEIKAERNIDSLLALHWKYYDALDYIHLSTLWHRLGAIDKSQRLRRSPAQLDALREHTLATMPQFGEQALSNISLSLARAGLSRKPPWPELWTAIAQEAQGRVGEFEEQHLSNTAWAFAKAGHKAPALFEAIAREAQGRMGEFNAQHLANTAWAFAVADARCDALFGGPQFVQACERHGKSLLGTRAALRQLEVWRQWRDACSADGRSWPTLPGPLLAACQQAAKLEGTGK